MARLNSLHRVPARRATPGPEDHEDKENRRPGQGDVESPTKPIWKPINRLTASDAGDEDNAGDEDDAEYQGDAEYEKAMAKIAPYQELKYSKTSRAAQGQEARRKFEESGAARESGKVRLEWSHEQEDVLLDTVRQLGPPPPPPKKNPRWQQVWDMHGTNGSETQKLAGLDPRRLQDKAISLLARAGAKPIPWLQENVDKAKVRRRKRSVKRQEEQEEARSWRAMKIASGNPADAETNSLSIQSKRPDMPEWTADSTENLERRRIGQGNHAVAEHGAAMPEASGPLNFTQGKVVEADGGAASDGNLSKGLAAQQFVRKDSRHAAIGAHEAHIGSVGGARNAGPALEAEPAGEPHMQRMEKESHGKRRREALPAKDETNVENSQPEAKKAKTGGEQKRKSRAPRGRPRDPSLLKRKSNATAAEAKASAKLTEIIMISDDDDEDKRSNDCARSLASLDIEAHVDIRQESGIKRAVAVGISGDQRSMLRHPVQQSIPRESAQDVNAALEAIFERTIVEIDWLVQDESAGYMQVEVNDDVTKFFAKLDEQRISPALKSRDISSVIVEQRNAPAGFAWAKKGRVIHGEAGAAAYRALISRRLRAQLDSNIDPELLVVVEWA